MGILRTCDRNCNLIFVTMYCNLFLTISLMMQIVPAELNILVLFVVLFTSVFESEDFSGTIRATDIKKKHERI